MGGIVLGLTDEPQSTRAWERGASGEQELGDALADMVQVKALHDRRVPGTRGNIDHILVAPAGVLVVDTKRYKGLIEVREVGDLFASDRRLFVGRRDCSRLTESMGWQVDAVWRVVRPLGIEPAPQIMPVLCFIDGEWPLLFPPTEHNGVLLVGKRSIRKLMLQQTILDATTVDRLTRILAAAFPPK